MGAAAESCSSPPPSPSGAAPPLQANQSKNLVIVRMSTRSYITKLSYRMCLAVHNTSVIVTNVAETNCIGLSVYREIDIPTNRDHYTRPRQEALYTAGWVTIRSIFYCTATVMDNGQQGKEGPTSSAAYAAKTTRNDLAHANDCEHKANSTSGTPMISNHVQTIGAQTHPWANAAAVHQ